MNFESIIFLAYCILEKKVIQFLIVLSKMAPVFYMFTQKNTEIQSSRMLTFWKVTPQDDHFNLYNLLRPT